MYVTPLPDKSGFSLVELAIVLVILGLLVGGVLSGQALIRSATIRSQLVQIDQIVAGARTFREKYFYYPGDLTSSVTTLPGGTTRQCWDGNGPGDGDGIIEMSSGTIAGESSFFWADITTSGMLAGKYTAIYPGVGCNPGANLGAVNGSALAEYFPPSKLGGSLYLYVWSNGVAPQIWVGGGSDGFNYITIAEPVNFCGYNGCGTFNSNPTVTVADAYAMDMKKDDGMPQTGGVLAAYFNGFGAWAGTAGLFGSNHLPNTTATAGSATTCYDNDGVGGTKHHYSIGQNNGEGKNCAVSFKF